MLLKFQVLFVTLYLAQQATCQEEDGVNFCAPDLCFCDAGIIPIDILCNSVGLKSVWGETDWNATFQFLNLTGQESIHLSFDDNELEHIPKFPPLNITFLSFKNNKIQKIEAYAFSELGVLESLNLANNELNATSLIEGVFFGKYKDGNQGYFPLPLKYLNLSHNNIHSIPKQSFDHCRNLTTLDLGNNPLVTLAGNSNNAIGELSKLEVLGLSRTYISNIPDGMLHELINLQKLDLSYNKLKTIPVELSHAKKLEKLNLDGNLFQTLDNSSFPDLNSLKALSLSNIYPLRTIGSRTFTLLKNLTVLRVSFNPHLREIDDAAFVDLVEGGSEEMWPISEVYLNDNGLEYVDEALMPWARVDYADLQNNPFRCDCNLEWMVKELVPKLKQSHPHLREELVCAEPKEMKGKYIEALIDDKTIFSDCTRGNHANSGNKNGSSSSSDPYKALGVSILVIGVLIVTIGLTILGFLAVKRRAISQALTAPSSQIRYERAGTEEGTDWRYSQPPK